VREDPHRVPRIEAVALHDRAAVPLRALEEEELVDPHLAGDPREERQRQLDHRVKADEAADAGIHLLHRNRRVTAAEGVNPALGGDRVGHEASGATDVLELSRLDGVEDGAGVGEPVESEHGDRVSRFEFRGSSLARCSRNSKLEARNSRLEPSR
jgi:hypothetical protein